MVMVTLKFRETSWNHVERKEKTKRTPSNCNCEANIEWSLGIALLWIAS